jgi:hypothetical protein
MQTHAVDDGYGTGNVFRANTIVGAVPGFAVGSSPADGNTVTCDNRVDDAVGLVGEHGKEIPCGPQPL